MPLDRVEWAKYTVRYRSLGRPVALKILSPDISSSPVLKARFEREAKIISTLHHPNICSVYDLCYEEDTEFLVMEFLEGELLSERLKKGPLPSGEAISVALEVTDALDSAHRRGIIHRGDLKPGQHHADPFGDEGHGFWTGPDAF